ncbi:Discoidin domain-containing receptor 2 [Halotydeus destructor]|nr:Discoidin domain-containing receptor 2 [Halotydeus destructor]
MLPVVSVLSVSSILSLLLFRTVTFSSVLVTGQHHEQHSSQHQHHSHHEDRDNVHKGSSGGDLATEWNPRTTLCDRSEQALGLESGALPSSAISASSSYSEQSVGPAFARLNLEKAGGAWCPTPQLDIAVSGKEWLQINLTDRHVVTGVATQGRFGNGLGVEYVEEFWIEYSRDNGRSWHKWKNRKGSHLLPGNTDTYSIKRNQLELPIVGANLIRLVPYSQYERTVCLRAELFGCVAEEGPLDYRMPDGLFGGRFGDLIDDSYDGTRDKNGYLADGLGQLSDGIKGTENYKLNLGFEWIGWKAHNETVDLEFTFPALRNFTSASFHCHNLYRKSVEVFSSARVYFSFDGRRWSKSPVDFDYMPDHAMETPRDVVIHLNHRIARHVRFVLKFAAKWMLVSEVAFTSDPVVGDYSENIDDLESLEVAQEAVEPPLFQGSNGSLAFVFIFLGVVLTCLVIIVAFAGLVYQVYLRRRKLTKAGNFYEVDVDFAIHGHPAPGHEASHLDGYTLQQRQQHDQHNALLISGQVIPTPVYCEPKLEVWRQPPPPPLGQLPPRTTLGPPSSHAGHEYAVPDIIYQDSESVTGKLSNKSSTLSSHHRLITNPLSDDSVNNLPKTTTVTPNNRTRGRNGRSSGRRRNERNYYGTRFRSATANDDDDLSN